MRYLLVISLLGYLNLHAQSYVAKDIKYDEIDFHPPMKIDLILSGNFGEMRSNHFHTGLDMKTLGVEGQNLYAVEEGYVSRIKVSPWGYGLAVYIDHPKLGLTSLYAHMQGFSEEIDSLVYAYQKKNESYIIDEMVLGDSIYIERGEFIGLSGNSGGSYAPHLHFELRETSTEHALNPLLFKSIRKRIADTTPPQIKGIKVYAVTEKGYMIPGKSSYYTCTQQGGSWVINGNQPIDVSELNTKNSFLAFGVHVTDKLDAAGNVCGVYHTTMKQGEQLLHEQRMEYMNFDHNRFLNSHQDYFEFHDNKKNIHKNFTTVINPLPIYPVANGLIPWDKCAGAYQYTAEDAYGNKVTVKFTLTYTAREASANPFDVPGKYLFPDSVNTYLKPDFQLLMESGTFYEPVQKLYKIDSNSTYITPIHQFSEYAIPLQKGYDVRMKVPELPDDFPRYKLGIGLISDRGYLSYQGGDYVDGWVETSTRSFGKFVLVVDSVAPVIKPLDFDEGKTVTKYKNMQLEIHDNLSGVYSYKAYINGEWVLMEYDRRKSRYIIPFSSYTKAILRAGKNKLRIIAKDRKGNETEGAWTIVY